MRLFLAVSTIVVIVPTAVGPVRAVESMAEQRLRTAIEATQALQARALEVSAEELERWAPQPEVPEDRTGLFPERFPVDADVVAYEQARVWSLRYRSRPERRVAWPAAADAPVLRALLEHADPRVRGLAVEALATLHLPEDVPRIARRLGDDAQSIPALGHNLPMTARLLQEPLGPGGADPAPVLRRSWHARTVSTYSRVALRLMTGFDLTEQTFDAWWHRSGEPRHALWYWERRLAREVLAAEVARDRDAAVDAIGAELTRLPAEVDAKVRLLAAHPQAGGPDIVGPSRRYWDRFDTTRLARERLLELAEGKGLWPDVDWTDELYSRLVERVALSAELHFEPGDARRLAACRSVSGRPLFWSAEAALIIGSSRLLPSARADQLDDPSTRDGALRAGVRGGTDPFVRGYVVRELVRVALEPNWPLLEAQLFAEADGSHVPDVRASIIEALGTAPLSIAKRRALRELLADPRFVRLWTMSRRAGMGRDAARRRAIDAVNAHASREVLTGADDAALGDPETAAAHLPSVLERVRQALR